MMQDTTRNRKLLGGLAGVTLALGVAVSAGAVPQLGANASGKTIAASASIEAVVPAPTAHQDSAAAPAEEPTTVAPTTVPPTTVAKATTPTTKAATSTTKTTKAPAPATEATTAPTAAPAAAAAPAAPVKAARRVPSAAEVQQAIATLPQYVHTIVTPTPAQVAQLGDQVCTAFDQGQTFAQVKATGLQMITQVPLTTVLPGGADWVVKTIVNLYCPGYASKLV